jgi:hypothetical protein
MNQIAGSLGFVLLVFGCLVLICATDSIRKMTAARDELRENLGRLRQAKDDLLYARVTLLPARPVARSKVDQVNVNHGNRRYSRKAPVIVELPNGRTALRYQCPVCDGSGLREER